MSAPSTPNPAKINVLISDGRKLIREGLSMLLEKDKSIRVVGEFEEARTAARMIAPLGAHVMLLILPAGSSGVIVGGGPEDERARAAVRDILASNPGVKLIVLSPGLTSPDLRQLIRAGAVGCLTSDCTSDELIAAVRHAIGGQDVFLSARLREQVARRYVNSGADGSGVVGVGVGGGSGGGGGSTGAAAAPRKRILATREAEVLRLIAAGQSTKEIAGALQVGTKTVETHRRRLMEKLNRYSVAELTQYAIMKGLIELPARGGEI